MRRLSAPQRAVLRHLADGGTLTVCGIKILSGETRVREVTLFALYDRGLVTADYVAAEHVGQGQLGGYMGWAITDAGRQALDASN